VRLCGVIGGNRTPGYRSEWRLFNPFTNFDNRTRQLHKDAVNVKRSHTKTQANSTHHHGASGYPHHTKSIGIRPTTRQRMATGIAIGAQCQKYRQCYRTPAIFSADAVAHGEGGQVSGTPQIERTDNRLEGVAG